MTNNLKQGGTKKAETRQSGDPFHTSLPTGEHEAAAPDDGDYPGVLDWCPDCGTIHGEKEDCPQVAHPSETRAGEQEGSTMEFCQICGQVNPTWFAPSELWNRVIPERSGMLCPNCFIARAERQGVHPTAWELRLETFPAAPVQTGEGSTDQLCLQPYQTYGTKLPDLCQRPLHHKGGCGDGSTMQFTGGESDDPNVIQHIKPENRTEREKALLGSTGPDTPQRYALDIMLQEVTKDLCGLLSELAAIRNVLQRVNPSAPHIASDRLKEVINIWSAKRKGWLSRRNWDQKRTVDRVKHLEQLLRDQRAEFVATLAAASVQGEGVAP